ncbi:MAG: type II secretion system protein [Hyphomicrobiaceae bacterium]
MTTQRGFTLIEMAIVLVIITILIGGLAMPLSAQIKARRVAETQKTLEEARDALVGFAMTHKTAGGRPYLPCPDTDGDGIENRNAGICAQSTGWFPWVTLGAAAQDAWGNRLLYAVQPELTDGLTGFSGLTTPPAPGAWYEICSTHTCATPDVASDVPVVLVSHGPNGWGARSAGGTILAAPAGPDEQENLDGDNLYISRPPSMPGNASGEYDDLTVWLSFNTLINRVCPAGGCP